MISVRWHGRGGQGCFTAARLLGAAAMHDGRHSLAFPSFGPERRGAPVLGFTRIADAPVADRSEVKACEYVIVLDESLLGETVAAGLRPGGILVASSRRASAPFIPAGTRFYGFDADEAARRVLGRPIVNTAMLGVLIGISGIVTPGSVVSALREDPGVKQLESNIALLKECMERAQGERR